MKKFLTSIANNVHKPGVYPIFYSGFQVGTSTVEGDSIMMSIDESDENDVARDNTCKELIAKFVAKKESVATVGDIDFDVIKPNILDATDAGYVVHDLPDYIPTEPSSPPPPAE